MIPQHLGRLKRRFPLGIDAKFPSPSFDPTEAYYSRLLHSIASVIVAADGSGDYEDIQSGIDSLPSDGGLVFMKAGTYSIDSALKVPSSTILEGIGVNTEISLAAGANCNIIENSDPTGGNDSITIRDLKLDGNYAGQSATSHGIVLDNAKDSLIDNVRIDETLNEGIRIDNCERARIMNNYIYKPHGTGMYLNTWWGNVQGNMTAECGEAALWLQNTKYSVVSNNYFYEGRDGIIGQFADGDIISNNILFLQARYGIYLDVSDLTVISGNTLESCAQGGVRLSRTSTAVVLGNTIRNVSWVAKNTYDAIFLTDDGTVWSTKNVINGNTIYGGGDDTRYGISSNHSSDDKNIVTCNVITGCATGRLNLLGSNDEIMHNI